MIPKEGKWLLIITTFLLIGHVQLQGERAYDTGEWIPITPKSLKTGGPEGVEDQPSNDRVLNLEAPAQKFFPDDEYEYRKRRPGQEEHVLRESPAQQSFEPPRPRKLKYASEYEFETPPPPPSKSRPQVNYYNAESVSPYVSDGRGPLTTGQNYYVPAQPKQKPEKTSYVAVPSINPQAPAPDAPNHYERYQLPFNASFYQSLNPSSINNEFYQAIGNNTRSAPKATVEKETVQLVYVPVENLKPNRPQTTPPKSTYIPTENYRQLIDQAKQDYLLANPNYRQQQDDQPKQVRVPLETTEPSQPLNQNSRVAYQQKQEPALKPRPTTQQFAYSNQDKMTATQNPPTNKQARLESIEQDFIQQALHAHRLQQQFRDDINPLNQELLSTAAKSKQRPHQPPLAVFLESQRKAEISDVLNMLRGAKTISVQDNVTPDSPQIFIGPSNLNSPDGYTKFPLPYLNNINGNRIERKIDQLPFFVAPVSYKAPPGYSKIALPSPHVGSVVVSIPIASTTPQPVLLNENQLNPFTFTSPGYGSLDPPRAAGPQQHVFDNYEIVDSSRGRYQSTPIPQVSESPVKDLFDNSYYTQPNSEQQIYKDSVDLYRPQVQQQERYEEVPRKSPSTAVKPIQNPQLPDINPLELAINEFELHQINDQFEEHNKVKHSTTRRPASTSYEDSPRSAPSRGRHAYENEATTERTIARGRVRGRGRGSATRTTSTTTTTTTTTTTATPETDRYTVLEEFVAREPSRGPTESYRSTAGAETEPPRRSTTQFSGNPYLPEENFEPTRPKSEFRGGRPQTIEATSGDVRYQTPKTLTQFPEETLRPQVVETNRFYSGKTEIENIPANVYSLGQPQTYENRDFERPRPTSTSTRLEYENVEQVKEVKAPSPSAKAEPAHVHRFSPEVVSYENREPNQHRPSSYVSEPDVKQVFRGETYEKASAEQSSKEDSGEYQSGYVPNLFEPNFDQTYISLQDQAVRSLLVPNLLAPSSKPESPSPGLLKEEVVTSTEAIVELPSTEAEPISTTTRANRVRGRGRARPTTESDYSSVTAAPRRPSSRRRPVSRTSTEKISATTDGGRVESSNKQKSRTRGRQQNHNEVAERIYTTENDVRAFKESTPNDYEALTNREPLPQSYTQFEQAIDEQQIITINPNLNRQVYEVPQQTTTPIVLEYDNTRARPTPVYDVHVIPEENERELQRDVYTKAPEEEIYVRHNNNVNIKSGGVLINNKPEETTKASTTRTRGRTRGRSRFATTTSTSRPQVTRISTRPTSAAPRITTQREEQEFYGFTRQPNYVPSSLNIQAVKQETPSASRQDESSIQFAEEIRPKYSPRTTPQSTEEVEIVETPRPRVRARTRGPARKTTNGNNYRQTDNDFHSARGSEQVTRRSGAAATRTRNRGSSHYRAPENVKRESDDEDVANQNYPANFLQKLDLSSAKPTTPAFQITVDPLEDASNDQSPYPSIYRPKFVPKPNDWVSDPNGLSSEDKAATHKSVSEEPEALAFVHTTTQNTDSEIQISSTETNEEPVTSKRKGAWKLVRHSPADQLEVSESQNYHSVLNAFDSIEKVGAYSKAGSKNTYFDEDIATEAAQTAENNEEEIVTSTQSNGNGEESIFDAIYQMFGVFDGSARKSNDSSVDVEATATTTTVNPTFPEEITDEIPTPTITTTDEADDDTTQIPIEGDSNSTESLLPTTLAVKQSTYEVQPWEMRAVKTSTSTEVTHETEICYKGRCVKSREKKKHK